MQWIEATIETTSEEIDIICERLAELGIQGVTIEDENDLKQFLRENKQYWDYIDNSLSEQYRGVCRVKFYVIDDANGQESIKNAEKQLGKNLSIKKLDDQDWEYTWRDNYQPIEIGKRLIILPEWVDDKPENKVIVRMDPGLAFGTGSHATTRMCLEILEKMELGGKQVLDLGFGSGILSIAAIQLGARAAAGCDVDPNAVTAARENALLNKIPENKYHLFAGNILKDEGIRKSLDGQYDLVMANIVADVIIALTRIVDRFLSPNGMFLCSGIIDDRAADTELALKSNGFEILQHLHEEEWNCYITARRQK